jgi:hypothetical protein
MFRESLFLETPKLFEKVAVTVKLPDDQSKWSPKILSELYRQVPVMESFHSTIILDRVDSKKGVGFGYITAQPKTLNPLMSNSLPKIKIPIIINNWQLSPFDIFFNVEGKGVPLTEKRINEVLMRADPFDSAQSKVDGHGQDVRTMLTPPWENVGQFHRGLNTQVKTSSLILPRLSNTVHSMDLAKLASWVKSDEGRGALYGDQEVKETFLSALRLKPIQSFSKEASVSGPLVKQYRWDGGPLMTIKVAQPQGFQPQQQAQPTQQAAAQLSPDQQAQVQQEGSTTEAPPLAVMSPQEMEMDEYTPVQQFGIYKVITVNNEQVVGWVFPFVLSFEMQKIPMKLFTDGTSYALHSEVPGVLVGSNLNLPDEMPQNRGSFYVVKNGRAFPFAPVEIMGEQPTPEGGVMYMCKTLLGGNMVQILKVQGLQAATVMGEDQYGIPMESRWLPFKQQMNPIVEDPSQATQRGNAYAIQKMQQAQAMQQQSQAQQAQAQTEGKGQKKQASLRASVRATQDGTYTLGGAPFEKLAREHTHFLDKGDAIWMLALAGIEPDYTHEKLASLLHSGGYMEVPVIRELTPPAESIEKIAARESYVRPLRVDLVKEATALGDPYIADTLLSLNFLSSKNINMFMGYVPQLDEVLHLVVNLLVASRVGLKEIPEEACTSAMHGLEGVIQGIKLLMLREGSI